MSFMPAFNGKLWYHWYDWRDKPGGGMSAHYRVDSPLIL